MAISYDDLASNKVDGIVYTSIQGLLPGTFDVMPEPSLNNQGVTILYTGDSDVYVKGTFYRSNGVVWEKVPIYGTSGNASASCVLGDGVHDTFIVTHGLGTMNFVSSVRTNDERKEYIDAVVVAVDSNNARITFSKVPSVDGVVAVFTAGSATARAYDSDSNSVEPVESYQADVIIKPNHSMGSIVTHETWTENYEAPSTCIKREYTESEPSVTDLGRVRVITPSFSIKDSSSSRVRTWVPLMDLKTALSYEIPAYIDVEGQFSGEVVVRVRPTVAIVRGVSWTTYDVAWRDEYEYMEYCIVYKEGVPMSVSTTNGVPGLANVVVSTSAGYENDFRISFVYEIAEVVPESD